jgi:DNA-binding beta-propeller fold protein YncE
LQQDDEPKVKKEPGVEEEEEEQQQHPRREGEGVGGGDVSEALVMSNSRLCAQVVACDARAFAEFERARVAEAEMQQVRGRLIALESESKARISALEAQIQAQSAEIIRLQLELARWCSTDGMQLQRRLDVRVETSLFAARPLLLWAFQSSKKQLQAIFTRRPSIFHVTAAQGHAFGSHFGVNYRQSLLTCSRLSVTLAVRFMCFRSKCAITHPLRRAACILSRRHELPGRLGGVAAAGAGFVRAIGSYGSGDGQLDLPHGGVAFDGEGNLVVSDAGNDRIQVFRYMDGAHLRTIGSRGAGNGQFNLPYGIAFDGAGHIIVSEYGGHRVQVLRYMDGACVRTIGSKGPGNGQFSRPTAIAVDGEGNIAVYDGGNARVQVHRLSDGAYIRTIGSRGSDDGQFCGGPCGVAFDSEGNLAVSDYSTHRVQVLRYSDGTHLRTIGSEGAGAGQFQYPTGVAFDAAGHIVIVDQINNCVQVLRYSDGAHVRTIGNGQFNDPQGGIAIDSDGRIVVADTYSNCVQVLE